MKRVLFLVADLCSRGAEHQMVTIATLMKKDGIDVSFFCYHTNNFFEQQLKDNGIPVTWKRLPNAFQRLVYVRRFIRNGRYDAVISFLQADNMLNCFAALGGKKWKVITGERSSKESLLTSCRGRIISAFMKKADFIVCNSENAKRMWQKHYPDYDDKLRVIYNHVLLPETTDNYVVRESGIIHIIVAGAYSKVKNLVRLVEAVSKLSEDERSALQIDWYGKMNANEEAIRIQAECEKLVKHHKLEDSILFHDAVRDIAQRMRSSDVVALFSLWEGLPNSICEAMALGKPVIMTRISDYSTLVDGNGVTCDPLDEQSICDALREVVKWNEKDLKKKAMRSLELANVLFSGEKILVMWKTLFE